MKEQTRCEICGERLRFDRFQTYCKNCGDVVEDMPINFGKEFTNVDLEQTEKRTRTGSPMTQTDSDLGLSTNVGNFNDLKKLNAKDRFKMLRIMRWNKRVSVALERNLKSAFSEINRIANYLKLPKSIEEEGKRIYRDAVQRNLVRGRSMEKVVAAALYAACRINDLPRTLDELSEASSIEKKEIGKTYRFITRELKIRMYPSNPVDYIARFTCDLKLSPETQTKAVEILEMTQKKELTSGRGPTGIAAAALYIAALINGEKRTQREVADVAGVTEVTIRNRYKELINKLKLEKLIKNKKKINIKVSQQSS